VIVSRCTVPPGCPILLGATVLRVDPAGDRAVSAPETSSFGALVGGSLGMRELYAMLSRLAQNDLSLLIQGETGTGKELAARAVHAAGRRAGKPFVVLDCTTIPAALAPSVLFGSVKGAYTGAEHRIGVFEAANGGVLFMDEVGELPLDLQPMLLRVLQQREVVPVGSNKPRSIDVRVMSATWRDLRAMVNRGTFREDLYYRLAQATVWMPSLAERREDIPLLIQHVLGRLPADVRAARAISQEAMEALAGRSYPGNVRELQSTVERLAMLADGPIITLGDLTFERMLAMERSRASSPQMAGLDSDANSPLEPFKEAKRTLIDEFEKTYLGRLLERTGRNLSRAAALAGLERNNLRDLLKKHGLYAAR
jgi:DNA-binding NtrC family response regulator